MRENCLTEIEIFSLVVDNEGASLTDEQIVHLNTCPECRAVFSRFDGIWSLIERPPLPEPSSPVRRAALSFYRQKKTWRQRLLAIKPVAGLFFKPFKLPPESRLPLQPIAVDSSTGMVSRPILPLTAEAYLYDIKILYNGLLIYYNEARRTGISLGRYAWEIRTLKLLVDVYLIKIEEYGFLKFTKELTNILRKIKPLSDALKDELDKLERFTSKAGRPGQDTFMSSGPSQKQTGLSLQQGKTIKDIFKKIHYLIENLNF